MWEPKDNYVLSLSPEEILRLVLALDSANEMHLVYSEELYAASQLGKKRFLGTVLKIEREVAHRKQVQAGLKE